MLVVAGFLLCRQAVRPLHLAAWPAIMRAAMFHAYHLLPTELLTVLSPLGH